MTATEIRFGYGVSHSYHSHTTIKRQLERVGSTDPMEKVYSIPNLPARLRFLSVRKNIYKLNKSGKLDLQHSLDNIKKNTVQHIWRDRRSIVGRLLYSENGLRERLTMFWTNHFTVSGRNNDLRLLIPSFIEDVVRGHLTQSFGEMLIASATHPAMIRYLHQKNSVGPRSTYGQKHSKGLNENYARELLELHTMGVNGGYKQNDVTELAKLLTGIYAGNGGFYYRDDIAEPGIKTVLGEQYGKNKNNKEEIDYFLRRLAINEKTAEHITDKLLSHFITDNPNSSLHKKLKTAFMDTNGDLKTIYSQLLDIDLSADYHGTKAKMPLDFVISSLRLLGLRQSEFDALTQQQFNKLFTRPLTKMSQPLFQPRGPDGWPDTFDSWIYDSALANRMVWSKEVVERYGKNLDPRSLLSAVSAKSASTTLTQAINNSSTKEVGLFLLLCSPEFNTR